MEILYLLTDVMVPVILCTAVIEGILYYVLVTQLRTRTGTMLDSLRNMVKGVVGFPDHDRTRGIHDEISALLMFLGRLHERGDAGYDQVIENVKRQSERMVDAHTFGPESLANVGGAVVQVFPLLGILGTILAIAQSGAESAGNGGTLDPSAVTSAFAIAMDTTILGILFGVVFMIVDSLLQARVTKILDEADRYRAFFERVEMRLA